ncbi:hypothetical protein [Frankia sp. Cas3]|uniref:hypothetical protein n=1 Tax=Frankia sp. Cas3 TaxID=3073926 RepID=UPI002AD28527|nr:hypothetical protein [Frankia sp. Cas3]
MDERTWIVDAANVIGARPDGWWRDRAGAALRLHQRLSELWLPEHRRSELHPRASESDPDTSHQGAHHRAPAAQLVVVLEGVARAGVPAGPDPTIARLVVVHAVGSGDDAVVDQIHRQVGPVLVVTADRELRRRVAATGAASVGPGWLWALLDDARSR